MPRDDLGVSSLREASVADLHDAEKALLDKVKSKYGKNKRSEDEQQHVAMSLAPVKHDRIARDVFDSEDHSVGFSFATSDEFENVEINNHQDAVLVYQELSGDDPDSLTPINDNSLRDVLTMPIRPRSSRNVPPPTKCGQPFATTQLTAIAEDKEPDLDMIDETEYVKWTSRARIGYDSHLEITKARTDENGGNTNRAQQRLTKRTTTLLSFVKQPRKQDSRIVIC